MRLRICALVVHLLPAAGWCASTLAALNAIEALGPKAAALKPYLAGLSPKGPSPDNRYDSYVPRQLASLTGKEIADPEEAPAPKARGKGKRKAGDKED